MTSNNHNDKKIGHSHQSSLSLGRSRGSTLLLSVLIVSSLGATIFVLGSLSVRNVKQVFSSVSGESVVLAADAALEQGLWDLVRSGNYTGGSCSANPPTYTDAGTIQSTVSQINTKYCRTFYTDSPTTVNVDPGETRNIYLVDPEDPQASSNYSEVSFNRLDGSGQVTVCEYVSDDCTSDYISQFYMPPNENETVSPLNYGGNNNDRYIIILEYTSGEVFSVEISAKDENGDPKGLPSAAATIRGLAEDEFTTRFYEIENILP